MKGEFTAIIEAAPEGGYWAICPEVPDANGQGETLEETKNSLREAIELILEDRKADVLPDCRKTPSKTRSWLDEALGVGASIEIRWLLPEARGRLTLTLDQSKDRRR